MEDICEAVAHPSVVCTGFRGRIVKSFVIVEGQSTLCPSFLSAVDRSFKLHFLFNIAYAAACEHVWHLLQKCVYVIHDNTSAFASVSNLSAYLNSKRRRADWFSRSAVVD